MTYNIAEQASKGRTRNDAIAALQFTDDRKNAGLAVASRDQLKRAGRLIAGNPTLRGFSTPLGLEQLALRVPLNRRERKAFKLRPRIVRTNNQAEVSAPIERVQEFVDANPGVTENDAALIIAGQAGYDGPGLSRALNRLNRFANSASARPCGHIRQIARMFDAIAKAVQLIRERDAAQPVTA